MNKWIIEDWAFDVEVIDGKKKITVISKTTSAIPTQRGCGFRYFVV